MPQQFAEDLFSVLGESGRPDFRWLIMGPARSGSSFHKDPNATSAWNAVVKGSKKWVLFPPHVVPPGVPGRSSCWPVIILSGCINTAGRSACSAVMLCTFMLLCTSLGLQRRPHTIPDFFEISQKHHQHCLCCPVLVPVLLLQQLLGSAIVMHVSVSDRSRQGKSLGSEVILGSQQGASLACRRPRERRRS